ncbi:hypothetical protein F2Q69_00030594 [Brassica cretica]|uniref:Uncharacterized protein n=2 Tax=Brassica cretica TaxID=69181 RepID=A0A8S9S421_BRACR|nr:hypothetical protein F2Q69_00030594 [Brassica cretica]KAF3606983.1 hypothetical protein DY000_02049133 [Brassica cretica]
MDRLKNNVGDWKEKWWHHGDAAKPTFISDYQWRNVRPRIHRDPTPEEQAELERQAEVHTSQLRDDLNLD